MGFTAPVTRATDFLVTAAVWNAEHVDNFNTAVMHLIARKTSDQAKTSDTGFADCTSMVLPVGANETWMFEFDILYNASTTGDMKLQFTIPTSSRLDASACWLISSASAALLDSWGTSSPTQQVTVQGTGVAGIRFLLPFRGIYVGGANAGNVTLQFAQNTSDATSTTIFTNSTVWGVKLA